MARFGPRSLRAWRARSTRAGRRWVVRTGRQLRQAWSSIARLTLAAVLAYAFVQLNDPGSVDLTGPLTALLVVQTSLVSTLRTGAGRVVAVLVGVLVAVGVSTWVPLSWWSLAAVIAASLLLAEVLRLESNRLETPISAMLVLAVAQHDALATTRMVNTLIGAAVGVCLIAAIPPPVRPRDAASAVRAVAEAAAAATRRAGEDVVEGLTRGRVKSWLDDVHAVLPLVSEADAALADAADARRLNPRAIVVTDQVPALRAGLTALDRSVVALRAMLLALYEDVPEQPPPDESGDQADLRGAFSVVLLDMADCLSAFGSLVVAEAEQREVEAEDALAQTLEILRETRAILTELYLVSTGDETQAWLVRGSILAAVERVLSELDVEKRARSKSRMQEDRPAPILTRLAVQHGRRPALWPGWDLKSSDSGEPGHSGDPSGGSDGVPDPGPRG